MEVAQGHVLDNLVRIFGLTVFLDILSGQKWHVSDIAGFDIYSIGDSLAAFVYCVLIGLLVRRVVRFDNWVFDFAIALYGNELFEEIMVLLYDTEVVSFLWVDPTDRGYWRWLLILMLLVGIRFRKITRFIIKRLRKKWK